MVIRAVPPSASKMGGGEEMQLSVVIPPKIGTTFQNFSAKSIMFILNIFVLHCILSQTNALLSNMIRIVLSIQGGVSEM